MSYICNLCENTRFLIKPGLTDRLGAANSKYKVVKCSNCSLHSLYPLPDDREIDIIYSNYAGQGDRENVEKKRMDEIYPIKLDKLKSAKSNISSILDIGAGLGGFVSCAMNYGYKRVIGIEMEKEQVRNAKKIFNVDLICSTFENFAANCNEKFDVVHMHHVLEHMKDPLGVLNNVHKLLNREGIVLFEVPNQFFVFPGELYEKFGLIKAGRPYNPFHHLYFFSPTTIKLLLIKSRFKVIELNIFSSSNIDSLKRWLKHSIAKMFNLPTSNVIEVLCYKYSD